MTLDFDGGPPFPRVTPPPPPPVPELKLELDEEALADATARSSRREDAPLSAPQEILTPTVRLPVRGNSVAPPESKAPDSIELPSDFAPVELTPIHQPDKTAAARLQSPLLAAPKGPPPRPLPEVPDLTPTRIPRSRGSLPPTVGSPRRGPAPAATIAHSNPPPLPQRSMATAPERRSPPAAAPAGPPRAPSRAGAAVPSRVIPAPAQPERGAPAQTSSEGRPPPPPRREKTR